MSNIYDPDQDGHFVCHDQGLNCLQRLSAGDKVAASKMKAYNVCDMTDEGRPSTDIGDIVRVAKMYSSQVQYFIQLQVFIRYLSY